MRFPIVDLFSDLQQTCGADARFYTIKVHLKSGGFEAGWPLDGAACHPEVLHLRKHGTICLIPLENVDKIYFTDIRLEKGVQSNG